MYLSKSIYCLSRPLSSISEHIIANSSCVNESKTPNVLCLRVSFVPPRIRLMLSSPLLLPASQEADGAAQIGQALDRHTSRRETERGRWGYGERTQHEWVFRNTLEWCGWGQTEGGKKSFKRGERGYLCAPMSVFITSPALSITHFYLSQPTWLRGHLLFENVMSVQMESWTLLVGRVHPSAQVVAQTSNEYFMCIFMKGPWSIEAPSN